MHSDAPRTVWKGFADAWSVPELETQIATSSGDRSAGDNDKPVARRTWLQGIREWQQACEVRRRRADLTTSAAAAARESEARRASMFAAERSQRIVDSMAELHRQDAAEQLQAAEVRSSVSGTATPTDDGGDVDGAPGRRTPHVPRPPSSARRGSATTTPLTPATSNHSFGGGAASSGLFGSSSALPTSSASRISKPTDSEPVEASWIPPTSNYDVATAMRKSQSGEFSAAVQCWDSVLKSAAAMTQPPPLAAFAVILSNRAATLMLAGCYEAAAEDCARALDCHPGHVASNIRLARCHLILGQYDRAKQLLNNIPKSRWPFDLGGDIAAADTLAQFALQLDHGNFAAALDAITRVCTSVAGGEVAFEVMRLEALSFVAPDDALDEAIAASEAHPQSPELRYWRGLFTFRRDPKGANAGEALREMLLAERLASASTVSLMPFSLRERRATLAGAPKSIAPRKSIDIRRAKDALQAMAPLLATIATAVNGHRWAQCVQVCNAAMSTDMLGHRKLRSYVLLCRARAHLAQYAAAQAASDCTDGLLVVDSPFLADLFGVRSDAHAALCDWARAGEDARQAYRLNPTTATFERVETTRSALERESEQRRNTERQQQQQQSAGGGAAGGRGAPRPKTAGPQPRPTGASPPPPQVPMRTTTHYELLEIKRDADRKTIARAYRDLALVWHPDKWAGKPLPRLREAEERFKAISNAYQVLTDPGARAAYDRITPG
jgi:tetratricopeptide (TPR) repeat protein